MHSTRLLAGLLVTAACCIEAEGANAQEDCSRALVPTVTKRTSDDLVNLSMASLISSEAYDDVKKQYGASAVIYGVPAGATYDDYKTNINRTIERHN